METALRAAVAKAEEDQAWARQWDHVDAGGSSGEARSEARREHLAHERATLEEEARESNPGTHDTPARGGA